MSLGFESDAFGIKMWKCVVSWFLPVSVCLKVTPLLGEADTQETLPKRISEKLQGGKNQVMRNPRLSQPKRLNQQYHKFAGGIKTIHVDQDENTQNTNCHLGGFGFQTDPTRFRCGHGTSTATAEQISFAMKLEQIYCATVGETKDSKRKKEQ